MLLALSLALLAAGASPAAAEAPAVATRGDDAAPLPAGVAVLLGKAEVLASAQGDLNGDGVADVAVATAAGEDQALLRVFFLDAAGKAALAVEAPHATCRNCGGAKAGPFPFDLSIKKGVLVIAMFGGSREAFDRTTRWRWQNGAFQLIGLTEELIDTLSSEPGAVARIVRDVNVSTLKMNETVQRVLRRDEQGKLQSTSKKSACKAPEKLRGLSLHDADLSTLEAPACSKVELP